MSRKFIAGVLAASIAIAGISAVPARAADNEDIARFLGVAATLFIIGKAIEQSNDKSKKKDKVYVHNPKKHIPTLEPRKKNKHKAKAPLPNRCLRGIQGNSHRKVMTERCLSRHYHSARPLPNACRITVNTNRGHRPAYGVRCLKNRGYTVARR